MKKHLFVTVALAASIFTYAQQKNTLLEQSFWKTNPDVTAVQAEIAKGSNPSASNDRAFDAVVMTFLVVFRMITHISVALTLMALVPMLLILFGELGFGKLIQKPFKEIHISI